MDNARVTVPCKLSNNSSGDVLVCLKNTEGRPEWFYSNSAILKSKSKFFVDQLSRPDFSNCVEIQCSESDYNHHVKFLKLLHLPSESLMDSLDSVKSAIDILKIAIAFDCEEITQNCIQYLEAVPWEVDEEEEILKVVPELGPAAMPVLARIQPVDINATKNVFVSAMRIALSIGKLCPPFGDELKTSAQEQVDYMLGEDGDTPLLTSDDEVKSVVKIGVSKICHLFQKELSSLLLDLGTLTETVEDKILQSVSDIEWLCNVLPKMDLMTDFVSHWVVISNTILEVVEDRKLESTMWRLKLKMIEVTGKAMEAVGYGSVILPAPCRVQLLKSWLPYIRKMKPLLDLKGSEETGFLYKMDEDLCQNIEGAIVSLLLALPSNDQADILAEWMKTEWVRYPDLSEAFEIWCYRTKSAKRRLVEGMDTADNATVSL